MADTAAWQKYFYPGTEVLRNKLNVRDAEELSVKEYAISGEIYDAFISGNLAVEGSTSSEKLRFIHGQLLGDVYDWAGEFRDVNMSKGGHTFGDSDSMGMYMRQMDGQINRTPWETLNTDETIDRLAEIHTDLNFNHPFREGNGRASRVFMTDLAVSHGVDLDFTAVAKDEWNQASRDTFLDPGGLDLDAEPLKAIYHQISSPIADDSIDSPSTGADTKQVDEELSEALSFGSEAYNGSSLSDALSDEGETTGLAGYDTSPVGDSSRGKDTEFDR